MNPTSIEIRPASPEDHEAAIPLIYSSGPAAWSYVFEEGKYSPFDFLASSFVRRGNTISYTNHYVATIGKEVVGTILAYHSSSFLLLNGGTAFRILSLYGAKSFSVIGRGLTMEKMIQAPKSGCLYLGHIAVSEKHRGKGIGKDLIRHVVNQFPKYGKVSLDVSQVNPNAIGLYQKLGFKTVEARSFQGIEGRVPNHYYMEADPKEILNSV
ncbi:GNAT family N-acetyltransferase [Leptospira idonii]|uniref:GNAT family N-acetyltransferase n=1 Tax=Leptospira idonii TaxID=1193500 RepID=A0A4R9LXL8_9LEPT|nr:N-acetyltransferase [Leptospira idonii]TGN19074.1 GNAT family N-acetyltransferase [Leptospira idonii]